MPLASALFPHTLIHRLMLRLLPWLFPSRETRTLSDKELQLIGPRLALFKRRWRRRIVFLPLALMALMTGVFCALTWLTEIPVIHPVWENRGGLPMACPSLFLAGALSLWIQRIYTKRYWGDLIHVYDRFDSLTSRCNAIAAGRWITAICIGAAIPLAVVCWHTGEAVGESGIVYKNGLSMVHHRPLEDVTAVERYSKYKAPIGVVDMANLLIRFKGGESLSIRTRDGQSAASALDATAAYIAQRLHLVVLRGEIPPG